MIDVGTAIGLVAARLQAAGIEGPRREARLILAAAFGVDAAGLLLRDTVDEAVFEPMVQRREAREPLAYILGRREFWGLDFAVSPATLIPRPDTETLVEAVLALGGEFGRVLDLGTGTGCLLLAVLHELPRAFGVGVDLVPEAATLAARNAADLGNGGPGGISCGVLGGGAGGAIRPGFEQSALYPGRGYRGADAGSGAL